MLKLFEIIKLYPVNCILFKLFCWSESLPIQGYYNTLGDSSQHAPFKFSIVRSKNPEKNPNIIFFGIQYLSRVGRKLVLCISIRISEFATNPKRFITLGFPIFNTHFLFLNKTKFLLVFFLLR